MEEPTVTAEPAWQLSDAIKTIDAGGCCGTNCCAQR
jgi:hypothetical protein